MRPAPQMAAHHLNARGKTRIAFIGAALSQDHRAKDRGAVFFDAVAATGRHPAIKYIIEERASVEVGGSALAALLRAHPKVDGVFFSNDALMLGALFECRVAASRCRSNWRCSALAIWISLPGARPRCRRFGRPDMKLVLRWRTIFSVASPIRPSAAPRLIWAANCFSAKARDWLRVAALCRRLQQALLAQHRLHSRCPPAKRHVAVPRLNRIAC